MPAATSNPSHDYRYPCCDYQCPWHNSSVPLLRHYQYPCCDYQCPYCDYQCPYCDYQCPWHNLSVPLLRLSVPFPTIISTELRRRQERTLHACRAAHTRGTHALHSHERTRAVGPSGASASSRRRCRASAAAAARPLSPAQHSPQADCLAGAVCESSAVRAVDRGTWLARRKGGMATTPNKARGTTAAPGWCSAPVGTPRSLGSGTW